MAAVYVTEQGARLGIDHQRLEVRKDDAVVAEFPLGHVERVIILGNVNVTTPTLKRLMQAGIDLVFLSMDGQYYGRIQGELTPHIALRRAQYQRQGADVFVLALAQRIVAGKIRNQRVLLQRQKRAGHTELEATLAALDDYEARAGRTQTLNALLGVEGSATARYFDGYRLLFDPVWHFDNRNRRPPRDPINVLLSFGYTLLTRAAESAVQTVGLDPYVGFLHKDVYNRPSLALDLMEEFRPLIEGLVLHVCHHDMIHPGDFRPGDEAAGERALVMERDAVKCYVAAYEGRMGQVIQHPRSGDMLPLWRFIELQAREIARCVREGTPDYQAAVFR
ncbi:MAG TPA: CRISPR-associated endonuclease Cas1 [Anaerolineae bacterium]|nr:CRISPR-associated endonuclease Cas1 [Anaerolineae bacterium]HQH38023.1 CRISPR-associated endonuclease Cas1 [Anaerolineae bacterium]